MDLIEDNITTFLTMRSHFKKIYDVRPRVNCWSESCPSKKLLKTTIDIRNFQVLPNYCNSTISSVAKKYDSKLRRPLSNKKKNMDRNLSYDTAYNDDDFRFESIENNNPTFSSGNNNFNRKNESKTIKKHQSLSSEYLKDIEKKKNKIFQNTTDESYQRFLEEMTNEVIRLDLCTDNALKNVFRKHIKHNMGKLDEKKMMAEVKKLQELLDLPSDIEDRYI